MSKPLGRHSARNTSDARKRRLLIAAAVLLLLVLLLVFAPALVVLLCVPLFIISLTALVLGDLWWARIPTRGVAGGILGGALVLFVVSAIVYGIKGPVSGTASRAATATAAASTAGAAPNLASFVGQACDADHLVMSQGTESNYCDQDTAGALVWVSAADHEAAVAKAEQEAAQKAAEEKAAAEAEAERKAAAKAKAEREAAAERAAEKAAEERAEQARQASSVGGGSLSTFYANCTAVRAAGADPIYSGDPGYSRKLDRDGDGVACE